VFEPVKAVFIALGAISLFCCQSLGAESGEDVERMVLEHRLKIKDLTLSFSSVITEAVRQVSNNEFIPSSTKGDIWFRSPNCFRTDIAYFLEGKTVGLNHFVRTESEWISGNRRENQKLSVSTGSLATIPNQILIDPRIVGIAVRGLLTLGDLGLEDELHLCHRGSSSVSRKTFKGVEVKFVSGQYEIGSATIRHRTWVAPTMGYSILQREIEDADMLQSVSSDVVEVADGIWFPSRVVVKTKSLQQDRIVSQEEVSITDTYANRGVQNEIFTIGSLGLDVGTQLASHGKHVIWNGTELVPDPSDPTNYGSSPLTTNQSRPRRLFLIVNALICVLMGGYLWWRKFRTNKSL